MTTTTHTPNTTSGRHIDGRRFARPRVYGWALFVTVNGRPRKVGEARTDGQYRSFMRGGTW